MPQFTKVEFSKITVQYNCSITLSTSDIFRSFHPLCCRPLPLLAGDQRRGRGGKHPLSDRPIKIVITSQPSVLLSN